MTLVTHTEHARLHLLARMTDLLSGSLDPASALDSIVRLALPDVSETCIAFLCVDGRIDLVAWANLLPAHDEIFARIRDAGSWDFSDPSPMARAIREERVIRVDDPQVLRGNLLPEGHPRRVLLQRLAIHTLIAAPMLARGEVLGSLGFSLANPMRSFSDADLLLTEQIARCAGLALQNSRLHEQLSRREQRYRELIDGLSVAIWESNSASHVLSFASPSIVDILGYPLRSWYEEPDFFLRVIHPDDRERVMSQRGAAIREHRLHTLDYRMLTSDRRVRWISDTLYSIEPLSATDLRIRGFITDVTPRMLQAEAAERRRVAGEIHDDLAQIISDIVRRNDLLERRFHEASPLQRQAILRAQSSAHAASDAVRQITENLRSTLLSRSGLSAALRKRVAELRDAGWSIEYQDELGDRRLGEVMEQTLYRIAAEGLRNVRKHAGVRRAELELLLRGEVCILQISDSGRGFDPQAIPGSTSKRERLGLRYMKERLELVGGRLEIESAPGKGARLRVEVPL